MVSKCYFPLWKQLMEQYFLLLNGKRAMKGKFKGKDAIFNLPNTSLEIKEIDLTPTWGNKFPLIEFRDGIGGQYGAISGALFMIDVDGLGANYLIFCNADGSQFGYLRYSSLTNILDFMGFSTVDLTNNNAVTRIFDLLVTGGIDSVVRPKIHDTYDLGYWSAIPFLKKYWRNLYLSGIADAMGFSVDAVAGVDGSFLSQDGKTVTVTKGIITSIA